MEQFIGALIGAVLGAGAAHALKKDKGMGAIIGVVAGLGGGYLVKNAHQRALVGRKELQALEAGASFPPEGVGAGAGGGALEVARERGAAGLGRYAFRRIRGW